MTIYYAIVLAARPPVMILQSNTEIGSQQQNTANRSARGDKKLMSDTYRTGRMNRTLFDVVDERHMIRRMPIEAVENRIELHRVD